jgi:hypothetical protein
MTRAINTVLASMLLIVGDVYGGLSINQGGNSDFVISQSGKDLVLADADTLNIALDRASFSIRSVAKQYYLCLDDSEEEIRKTVKPGANTKNDFTSCFFIWKLYAGSAEQDYLVISDGGSNSINESHGLKLQNDSSYQITITRFLNAGDKKFVTVNELDRTLYGAFWLDKNGDAVVDEYELKRIRFHFK